MPVSWLALAVQAIPWDTLLKQTPAIINATKSLMAKTEVRRKPSKAPAGDIAGQLEDLKQRLSALEGHDQSHAEVVKQMASQLEGLTRSLEVVSARIWIALCAAGFSLLIAIIVWGITLLR
jgi:hypothetical protein